MSDKLIIPNDLKKEQVARRKQHANEILSQKNEWYDIRSLLGNTWAMFYCCVGGREVGKSYQGEEFVIRQWRKRSRQFIWIRLSKVSTDKMLRNDCEQMFAPELRRKYKLDLTRVGNTVYEVLKRDEKGKVLKKKMMGRVLALSEMAKEKGVSFYDSEYQGWVNVVVDEFVREARERDTFSVRYNLANTIENLIRSRKNKVRIIMFCNYCSDISDVLAGFDFLPEEFGRYYLKSKKAVIDYIPITENYKRRRKGAAANILLGDDTGNFNNKVERDKSRIWCGGNLGKPKSIIKFSKVKSDWFIYWSSGCISRYKNEKINDKIAMRPYIDETFEPGTRDTILLTYDARGFFFKDLITQSLFEACLKDLAPRGS